MHTHTHTCTYSHTCARLWPPLCILPGLGGPFHSLPGLQRPTDRLGASRGQRGLGRQREGSVGCRPAKPQEAAGCGGGGQPGGAWETGLLGCFQGPEREDRGNLQSDRFSDPEETSAVRAGRSTVCVGRGERAECAPAAAPVAPGVVPSCYRLAGFQVPCSVVSAEKRPLGALGQPGASTETPGHTERAVPPPRTAPEPRETDRNSQKFKKGPLKCLPQNCSFLA